MYHAMSHRLDVGSALDFVYAGFFRSDITDNIVQRAGNIVQRTGKSLGKPRAVAKMKNRLAADAFDLATAKPIISMLFDSLQIGGNHLKLQTGASRIHHQHVHRTQRSLTRRSIQKSNHNPNHNSDQNSKDKLCSYLVATGGHPRR